MTSAAVVEAIGILSAILVLVSYLFTDQRKLRICNLIASVVFVVYGISLAAVSGWVNGWSTIALNSVCIVIHIFWLWNNRRLK